MFDKYSLRARQVIFGARLKAGERGGSAMSVGDLVLAIVLEDQNKTNAFFHAFGLPGDEATPLPMVNRLEPHRSFFSAEKSAELLAAVEGFLPRATAIPSNTDMPITDDLRRVLERAEKIRTDSQHNEIEPLHLLVAVLEQDPNEVVSILEKAGVTKEAVIAALKK